MDKTNTNRRQIIKAMASTSSRWVAPAIITTSIPSHAQTTTIGSCTLSLPNPECVPGGASNIADGGVQLGEFMALKVFFNIYDLPNEMMVSIGLTTEEDYPYTSAYTSDYYFRCSGNNDYRIDYQRNGYIYSFKGNIYPGGGNHYRTHLQANAKAPDGTIQRNTLDIGIGLSCHS